MMLMGDTIENIVTDPSYSKTGNPNTTELQFSIDTDKIPYGESEWTVCFNITKTTFGQGEFNQLRLTVEKPGPGGLATQLYQISEGVGKIVKKITINTNLITDQTPKNQLKLMFYSDTPGKSVTITDVLMVRGHYSHYIDHFTGSKGLGPEIHLISHNKNLTPRLEVGTIDISDGSPAPSPYGAIRFKDFIRVQPNTPYVFSASMGRWRSVLLYDINKKYLGVSEVDIQTQTDIVKFTTPQNCFYVKCRVEGVSPMPTNLTDAKFQFEMGSNRTLYVKPGLSDKKITLNKELQYNEILIFDHDYKRLVIKEVGGIQPNLKLGDTKEITNYSDINLETFEDQTWFSVLDKNINASLSTSLLGKISYDYEIDPEYDSKLIKHSIYILKSGDMIDGKLYKTIKKKQTGRTDYIEFTDGFYGNPDKYVIVSDVVKILGQEL